MPLSPGDKLGPYEILLFAGEGGMGEVYRARDSRLGREVAIKILSGSAITDPARRSRFETESRAASALNHPNILAIFDIGEHAGQPYMVSEFVDGETLRATIDRGSVPIRRVLDIAVQLADGLAAAHTAGITHRDLKPDNVMLTRDGRVKILDFGLAKVSTPAPTEATVKVGVLSEPGTVMGTVTYMSPEQARGAVLDYRTDQFSFGVLLHEMLTGKQPFTRDSVPETMTAIIKDDAPPLDATVPVPLRWWIERMLAKSPEDRYASTKDLFHELRTLKERLSEVQSNTSQSLKAVAPSPPRRRLAPVLGAGFLGAALFTAGLFVADNPTLNLEKLTFTPLASGRLLYESLSWSADGKSFLIAENNQILQYPLDGGPPVVLLTVPEDRVASIHPAPDGLVVYFTAMHEGSRALFSVGAAGGQSRVVYKLGGFMGLRGVAISPDGKTVVVSRSDEKGISRLAYASPIGSALLDYPHTIEWKGASRRYLQFSPDGKRLLLVESKPADTGDPAEAYMLPWPPSAGAPKKLPMDKATWRMAAAWLPDARHLIAAASTRSGEGFRLLLTDDRLHAVSYLTTGSDTATRFVSTHADGRTLVAERNVDYSTIAIPLDGGQPRTLGSDFLSETYPARMPNGERFVSFVNRRGENQIWLFEKDGTAVRSLVTGLLGSVGLEVSPDGRQIAFSSGSDLYLVPSSGGSPVRIAHGAYPSWSPDGRWLVFQEGSFISNRLSRIQVGPGQNSEPVGLIRDIGPPAVSPDGKWIAATVQDGILAISADGTQKLQLSKKQGRIGIAWDHDSRSLYYSVALPQSSQIWKTTLEAKETMIRDFPGINISLNTPHTMNLSPDGKTLLTTESRTSTRILLLEGMNLPRRFWQRWWSGR